MIGRLGSGILADKIGTYNTNILGNSLFVIMYFVWLGVKTSTAGCIVLVVIMGIAGGSFVCLQPALAVMTAKDMRYGGTMMGQSLCESSFLIYCFRVDVGPHGREFKARGGVSGVCLTVMIRRNPIWSKRGQRQSAADQM